MENSLYNENVFTTTDMRLAVILLIFGSKLSQHLPLEWTDIYLSVDKYLENLECLLQQKPETRIAFNFELINLPDQIAIQIRKGQDLGILINQLAADGATEAILAARQHLYDLIVLVRDKRPDTKWDLVRGHGAGELVTFGKRASIELQEEFLSKL